MLTWFSFLFNIPIKCERKRWLLTKNHLSTFSLSIPSLSHILCVRNRVWEREKKEVLLYVKERGMQTKKKLQLCGTSRALCRFQAANSGQNNNIITQHCYSWWTAWGNHWRQRESRQESRTMRLTTGKKRAKVGSRHFVVKYNNKIIITVRAHIRSGRARR